MNIAKKLAKLSCCIFLLLIFIGCTDMNKNLPQGFVFLTDIDPTIVEDQRYYTDQNFLGRPVSGYKTSRIVCTKKAAEQLKQVQVFMQKHGYKLVVYDGYRPQTAVKEFMRWGENENDIIAKSYYYPTLHKKDLFQLGYIADKKPSHTRGSTFDLTIIKADQELQPISYAKRKLLNGEEIPFLDDNTVDMGASFDLFHKASHHDSPLIESSYTQMRNFLRDAMKQFGFKEYAEEWWHYTLENEPYPDTYFDFVVET